MCTAAQLRDAIDRSGCIETRVVNTGSWTSAWDATTVHLGQSLKYSGSRGALIGCRIRYDCHSTSLSGIDFVCGEQAWRLLDRLGESTDAFDESPSLCYERCVSLLRLLIWPLAICLCLLNLTLCRNGSITGQMSLNSLVVSQSVNTSTAVIVEVEFCAIENEVNNSRTSRVVYDTSSCSSLAFHLTDTTIDDQILTSHETSTKKVFTRFGDIFW